MTSNSVYQFRVQVEDLPSIDFLFHILVQNNDLPQYVDLIHKIKEHSKNSELDINHYYIMIKRDDIYKFKFNNDVGLQNAFGSITEKDRLEIKLMRINGAEPLSETMLKPILKPIFSRRASQIEEIENEKTLNRKDSGICFDLDLLRFDSSTKLEEDHNIHIKNEKKLPTLSHIITTKPVQWSPNHDLPLTPNPIKLPGFSSLIFDYPHTPSSPSKPYPHLSPYNFQKSTTPLLSPSLSVTSETAPIKNKRIRGGSVPHQSQFMCDHVDATSGKTCSQAFCRSYDLSRHQMIHLKNRPFCYCHACGKKFTRLDALRRHERIQGHNK